MNSVFVAFLAMLVVGSSGCGYHVSGSVKTLPEGIQSLGIPTFRNLTPQYKVEQQITAAVLKEFSARTRARVDSNSSGVDAVLVGEIRSISSSPVTFGTDTFGSAFLITLNMAVKLVRTKDDVVLWENPDYLFRERYIINRKVVDFFSEEGPAIDRLSREFAASLASSILNR